MNSYQAISNNSEVIFSIAISAYKEKFFRECIASVLSQSCQLFELIILNDRSPQGIAQTVSYFNDNRIKYIENDNNVGSVKLVENWNKCLQMATGDFFVIMGDDDTMEPDYLEEFLKLIDKHPDLDVYHCRTRIIDEESRGFMLSPSWPEFESVYDSIWHRLTERRAQYISDFVYRTSTLKSNGGFYNLPYAWGSDDITAFIATGAKGVAHTNKPVFNYRSNQYSITSTGNYSIKMDAILLQKAWFEEFLKTEPIDKDELIVFNDLKRNIGKYIQKKKIHNMKQSMIAKTWKNLVYWIVNRRKFGLSIKEILFSLLESYKVKLASAKYKK